ncbi:hypothetical protein F5Y19DRAFT_492321 [Xylariaceae sp. FL1651]|nr:hypothetical protein F5Y19DRAFT_492321 [Xylariaceae sp. FL1651]
MAAPRGKPSKTSNPGHIDKPIYARTNVLCNGQIAWKVGWELDLEYNKADPQKADLRPIIDVKDDLNALNSLQIQRARSLTPIEVKQPLRHVHSCLPKAVRAQIYTGDLYGSAGDVFSCPDNGFKSKKKHVFGNEVRANRDLIYNDFFRRLRRAQWFLWDVEAEKGHWVAVLAHLYKKDIRNPAKRENPTDPDIPSVIPSPGFNRIDQWCVVTARRSPEGNTMVDRVRKRLPEILKEGRVRFDKNSEINPAIWVPMDESNWSSGIRVYALIKTLMHRITEFYCKQVPQQQSFWDPLPGWLNVDEVRAEMQGRAAQRCLAATGYRSRIAIEGVRRWIGVKEKVRADELRPRHRENRAYQTGKLTNGRCVPIMPPKLSGDNSDSGSDEDDDKGPPKGPPFLNPPPASAMSEWNGEDEDYEQAFKSDSSSDEKKKQPNPSNQISFQVPPDSKAFSPGHEITKTEALETYKAKMMQSYKDKLSNSDGYPYEQAILEKFKQHPQPGQTSTHEEPANKDETKSDTIQRKDLKRKLEEELANASLAALEAEANKLGGFDALIKNQIDKNAAKKYKPTFGNNEEDA